MLKAGKSSVAIARTLKRTRGAVYARMRDLRKDAMGGIRAEGEAEGVI
jgi:hypothetical protein